MTSLFVLGIRSKKRRPDIWSDSVVYQTSKQTKGDSAASAIEQE